jgi:hypothetical protein
VKRRDTNLLSSQDYKECLYEIKHDGVGWIGDRRFHSELELIESLPMTDQPIFSQSLVQLYSDFAYQNFATEEIIERAKSNVYGKFTTPGSYTPSKEFSSDDLIDLENEIIKKMWDTRLLEVNAGRNPKTDEFERDLDEDHQAEVKAAISGSASLGSVIGRFNKNETGYRKLNSFEVGTPTRFVHGASDPGSTGRIDYDESRDDMEPET